MNRRSFFTSLLGVLGLAAIKPKPKATFFALPVQAEILAMHQRLFDRAHGPDYTSYQIVNVTGDQPTIETTVIATI